MCRQQLYSWVTAAYRPIIRLNFNLLPLPPPAQIHGSNIIQYFLLDFRKVDRKRYQSVDARKMKEQLTYKHFTKMDNDNCTQAENPWNRTGFKTVLTLRWFVSVFPYLSTKSGECFGLFLLVATLTPFQGVDYSLSYNDQPVAPNS